MLRKQAVKYLLITTMITLFPLSTYAGDKLNIIDTSWILTPVLIIFLTGIPLLMLFHCNSKPNADFSSALLVSSSVSAISSALWLLIFYVITIVTGVFF